MFGDPLIMSGNRRIAVQASDVESARWVAFTKDSTMEWNSPREYNVVFLRAQQQYMNDMLHAKGYLFLNDVLKSLGLPLVRVGQLVGWTTQGSRFVSFGNTLDGNPDGNFLLQFNFEGVIYDKVDF